ncbi:SixA phosphatase family protein [Marinobacterium marinum]|uniref:Histidine phosphatase family protein n=1 Tax=Marinobacterium marinum TaxID=2756129 RepID=A0A7W2ABW8_9GAMM|nr:histidine phosphatase family protein [Marinobacterium marinum]MBA4501912.1 histidine phosphatase family protein [Marinobacterium marinum]
MRLLVLRHAEAVSGADLDPCRELTPQGRVQAQMMASRLESLLGDFRLLSSPWVRARSTAAELTASENEISSALELIPTASVAAVAVRLEPLFATDRPLVLLTHQPLCGRLIHWLTEGQDQPLSVAPCSGALLELDWPAAGMARLVRWLDPHTP